MKTLDDFCSKDEVTKRIDSLEKKLKRGRKIMKIIRKFIYPLFFLDAIAMIVLMFFDIKNTIFAGIFYGSIGIIGVSNILINIEDIEQQLSREREILEELN